MSYNYLAKAQSSITYLLWVKGWDMMRHRKDTVALTYYSLEWDIIIFRLGKDTVVLTYCCSLSETQWDYISMKTSYVTHPLFVMKCFSQTLTMENNATAYPLFDVCESGLEQICNPTYFLLSISMGIWCICYTRHHEFPLTIYWYCNDIWLTFHQKAVLSLTSCWLWGEMGREKYTKIAAVPLTACKAWYRD